MDNFVSIFKGILSTDGTFLDIYLDGLEEHRKLGVQSEGFEIVQHITSLLTKSTTRPLGLRLLSKYLDNCSNVVLEKKGNLWTTLILKSCNIYEFENNAQLIFAVLGKMVERSQHIPDLAKSFASSFICKTYECIVNVPSSKIDHALNCIETCLRTYPASSGSSKGIIERFLWKYIDHLDDEVVKNCGKCLHLLQQVKGGGVQGINQKTQWKNYQLQILASIHSVFNEMFSNCIEMYDEKIDLENLPWQNEQIEFDTEPVRKAAQMYTRCHNMITYLTIALREPFPVEKPILIKKILNVVIRGLSVNSIMLEQNPIADNIALIILLPKLHVDLLELLNTALLILRGHCRPYVELIFGLIIDTLKWTSAKNIQGEQKSLCILRKKIYETVSLWCKILCGGNRIDTIAEYLFQEILSDITPTQNEFTLKVLSGARKHMSKKARRQLHMAQNDKSNMAQTHSYDMNRKEIFSEMKNQELCISALHCLQDILFSVSNFIKPTILKTMHIKITQICAILYELPPKTTLLYNEKNCRIEIYNVLFAILMNPHHLCPPPAEVVLTIIQSAYVRDNSFKVRTHCAFLLQNIEKIIHPQKESLLFAIEARDIRNTFIKLGQEHLLDKFGLNLLNTFSDKNSDDNFLGTIVPEVLRTSISANENDNEEYNDSTNASPEISKHDEIDINRMQPNASPKIIKHDEMDNNEMQTARVDDINIIELETIENQNNDFNIEIKTLNHTLNLHNDHEVVLLVDKDTSAVEENSDNDEPKIKKKKVVNDHFTENVLPNEGIVEDVEENLLADIASQFVDELD